MRSVIAAQDPVAAAAAGGRRWPRPAGRRALLGLGLGLGLGLAAPGRSAAQGPPPPPELVPVAQAYTAAWNAHDLPAVRALFAPDAVVRERWGPVPPEVWETREPQVVRAYLEGSHDGDNYDTGGFAWVTGRPAIAAWAAARFAQHHRFRAGPYRGAGDKVSWPYQEFVDPFQRTPGASPLDGDAEALVRDGLIAVLSLVQAPASVRRQRDEAATAFDRAMATQRASPLQGERGGAPLQPPRGPAAPTGVAWPLGLAGLALLSAATVMLRRRRRP